MQQLNGSKMTTDGPATGAECPTLSPGGEQLFSSAAEACRIWRLDSGHIGISTGGSEVRGIFSMLTPFAKQGRWIAWIAPQLSVRPEALSALGIDPKHIMLVRPSRGQSALELAEETIRHGQCCALLLCLDQPEEAVIHHLKSLATTHNSTIFLIETRPEITKRRRRSPRRPPPAEGEPGYTPPLPFEEWLADPP
jgi:hypothetical protein